MAEYNELTVIANYMTMCLYPKLTLRFAIVPNPLSLKLSRLNDAIAASPSWQLRVEHSILDFAL